MTNPSGIQPIEYNVLVKKQEVETKTKGGIILPDMTKEREEYAQVFVEVVACSPIAFNYDESAPRPFAGNTVMMAKYAGVNVRGKDGVDYTLVKDKDITAIIKE